MPGGEKDCDANLHVPRRRVGHPDPNLSGVSERKGNRGQSYPNGSREYAIEPREGLVPFEHSLSPSVKFKGAGVFARGEKSNLFATDAGG